MRSCITSTKDLVERPNKYLDPWRVVTVNQLSHSAECDLQLTSRRVYDQRLEKAQCCYTVLFLPLSCCLQLSYLGVRLIDKLMEDILLLFK